MNESENILKNLNFLKNINKYTKEGFFGIKLAAVVSTLEIISSEALFFFFWYGCVRAMA